MKSARRFFLVAILLIAVVASAATTQVIYSFSGDVDGQYPDTDLVIDSAGKIYGTAVQGGLHNAGAVFQLSPSGNTWAQTTLYSFKGGLDGGQPYKGVTLGPDGNIYGTAVIGGTGGACEEGCGVIFKLVKSGGSWKESVLYNFTGGADGAGPGAGLTFDQAGNIYGMTAVGGDNALGVIYQLHLQKNGKWKFAVIHSFTGGKDGGGGSAGRMILDAAGNFFGTVTAGGAHGDGIVFKLTRNKSGAWKFKTLYAFKGEPDGAFPYSGLVMDATGNLYGTTYYDGEDELGTVYQLTRGQDGKWTEKSLHSFTGGSDGGQSTATPVFDKAGNLYGSTSIGGDPVCNCGVIFKLTPNGNTWKESIPHRFTGIPDAGVAYNGMVRDAAGNLYGATVHGGNHNAGAIYKVTP